MIHTEVSPAIAGARQVTEEAGSSAEAPDVFPVPLKPFQSALLEQAIARVSDLYDPDCSLLSHPVNPGFKPIRESLCYAGLLLLRNRAQEVSDSGLIRARSTIDAVLARQNRNLHGASGGAFPLAWSEEKRKSILDLESRQLLGSLLAVLARDYAVELGKARTEEMDKAVRLALRGGAADSLATTAQRQLHNWLEVTHGDSFKAEEMLIELTDLTAEALATGRFGKPQAFSHELWAAGLWRGSDRLKDWGGRLLDELMLDVGSSLHGTLHQLLGGALASRVRSEGGAQWINVWLTWLKLGSNPLMPRDLPNPLDATLFAFPALSGLAAGSLELAGDDAERQVERVLTDRVISAWLEPELHLEACSSDYIAPGSEPVMAAFWRRDPGVAWLTCQATASHRAVCDRRSVKLTNPGKCRVTISTLGEGSVRLVEDGWELPGLRFTCRGFTIGDAERTPDGLSMILRPQRDHPLLILSPHG